MTHPPRARAWTPALMLHLTNQCAKRKVLNLTKPKGKIYKTKSLGHYITYAIYYRICRTIKMELFNVLAGFNLVVSQECLKANVRLREKKNKVIEYWKAVSAPTDKRQIPWLKKMVCLQISQWSLKLKSIILQWYFIKNCKKNFPKFSAIYIYIYIERERCLCPLSQYKNLLHCFAFH